MPAGPPPTTTQVVRSIAIPLQSFQRLLNKFRMHLPDAAVKRARALATLKPL
jgi:hypothetical protein